MNHTVPDGLVLRTATPSDLDQIGKLLAERGDTADAADHRLVVEDPDAGWQASAVVTDGDRVVSTLTLLDETLYLADVPIPAGQVGLVATDQRYEGRGLARALLGWAHERSAGAGQLVQLTIGIRYFYRQFGYAYAPPFAVPRRLAAAPPPPAPGYTIREAGRADIPHMATLQDAAQAGADVRMPHAPACWRWLVDREHSEQWVVERDGFMVATGRIARNAGELRLAEVAALDPVGAQALLPHARALAGDAPVRVNDRPGTVAGGALAGYLGAGPEHPMRYYLRVAEPGALLEHLRPVLSGRLADSEFADADGELTISFFRSHVQFAYQGGEVGPVTTGGVRQSAGPGGAEVAPDLLAPLLFGPDGFAGLARQHPDVYADPAVAPLLRVLFPPVHSDLLTFYLP